jgi:hypothetical protein
MSDHPFGAYYHWCALLCAFGEVALDHGLLSPLQLEPIRQDIQFARPQSVPAAPRRHSGIAGGAPRIMSLLRDGETLARLRRVHQAFGEALRNEEVVREIDSLDQ